MIRVSRYQLVLMLVWTVLATGILTMPATMATFSVRDTWLSSWGILLGGTLCAGLAWCHVRLFPDRSLTAAMELAFGRFAGKLAAVWVVIWLVITLATICREFGVFVTTIALPNTPEYLVVALALACSAYLVYLGLEVVGRVNEFLVPIAAIVFPLLFVLALRWFDWTPLQPVLADGWLPVWRAGVVPAFAYGLEFSLALQWVPYLNNPRALPVDILLSAGISALVLMGLVLITDGVIGAPVAYLNYPVLEVVRAIRVGKFVERLDTWYAMGVVSTLVLKQAAFQTGLAEAFRTLCGTRDPRWSIWPTALLVWSLAYFLFRNSADVSRFILHTVPGYFLFTAVLLPLLVYAAAFFRGVRPASRAGAGEARR
ncbi:endospore germination permease [Alicyclobacillus sp.]|uniref:GerAB/ArcD/ProY family transporter n=1 Tax=Alicyclobacillus sp. TaxID=61169 RepID=UPI0025C51D7B|nr:endospore germination permease [Alicyclobacillus sp.]MCL6516761.1 spore germination protein [Alicyclobacillus sp.]